jgi:hypothetical protein
MPEGLSATEVGKEIAEHSKHAPAHAHERRDRAISVMEAALLSLVAVLAAWSGYAAAKWSTESRVSLAKSSSLRARANREEGRALATRNFDSSTFDAWFSAYIARNQEAMRIAERRFRSGFKVAFDAWRATNPETNPHAPKGPTYMPQYHEPGLARAAAFDEQADDAFLEGEHSGSDADKYVRLTVLLASILFLVGISTHFPFRGVRYGLIGLGIVLLVVSLVQLSQLPLPPR